MAKKEKIDLFRKDAINKMFEISNNSLRYKDVVGLKTPWYSENTITEDQHKQWKKWFVDQCLVRKLFFKSEIEKQFTMFDLNYGLKVEN